MNDNATSNATSTRPEIQPVMYTTSWCGYCRRLKRALAHHGVELIEVDVDAHPEFNSRIEEATGGYRTVPTVQIGDELLVNPTADQVLAKLRG